MDFRHNFRKIKIGVLVFSVPVLVLISSAIFPLKPITRQVMIAIMLIWFQLSLWLGDFSNSVNN